MNGNHEASSYWNRLIDADMHGQGKMVICIAAMVEEEEIPICFMRLLQKPQLRNLQPAADMSHALCHPGSHDVRPVPFIKDLIRL